MLGTADDSVDDQVFQRTGRHELVDPRAELFHQPFDPFLRIGPQDESRLEHNIKEDEEDGEAPETVGDDAVDRPRESLGVGVGFGVGLLQRAGDEGVFGVGDSLFAVLPGHLLQAFRFPVAHGENLFPVRQGRDDPRFQILVVLEQLDGQEAGGIFVADVRVLADFLLHRLDARLDLRPVVDMDVADEALVGEGVLLFRSLVLVAGDTLVVPFAELAQHLVLDCTLLLHEVGPLIQADDDVEQVVDASSRPADSRHDRHAQQFAQPVDVEFVSAVLQRVEHVEGDDHAHVHVDELCGEVEVAFQVARIHHVDDHVGCLLDDVFPHIKLLGTVGRERISARQVDQAEMVALELKQSLFGVDGDPTVVAHVLMSAGGDIEERGLSAVRVAHQCHVDGAPLAQREAFHGLFRHGRVLRNRLQERAVLALPARLFLAHYLNHGRFLTPERHFVTHHFVFYGVLQRRVEHNLHCLSFDEPHFDDPPAESSVTDNFDDHPFLAGFQFRESHVLFFKFVVFL